MITKLRLESKELDSKVESFVWDCKVIVFAVLALTLEFVLECKTWLLRGVLLILIIVLVDFLLIWIHLRFLCVILWYVV